MSYYLNTDEIFQVGVEIERNGKAFYEAAAERAPDPGVRALCRELAAWETRHVELFEALRRALPAAAREGQVFDPNSEESGYLKAAADTHVFLKSADVAELVARCRTGREILDLAIGFEKDSVVFYAAMKNVVPKEYAAASIDGLVDEELKHVAILTAEREKVAA
ncbi:MAG: ferritin family protein [Deltaproteobacteria bacterium]|nr:ferritin family protein [Deltaproteobacteria bacterium]